MTKKKIAGRKVSKAAIEKRLERKVKPKLRELVIALKKQKKPIWLTVAKLLTATKRKATAVNLNRLNRLTKEGETIVIPGKLLAAGSLDHRLTIAAFSTSAAVKEKIKAKARLLTIDQLIKENPSGSKVRIIQ